MWMVEVVVDEDGEVEVLVVEEEAADSQAEAEDEVGQRRKDSIIVQFAGSAKVSHNCALLVSLSGAFGS